MRAALPYLRALVATNLKASFALRASFWTQVAFMVLNNLLYFVMCWMQIFGWRCQRPRKVQAMARPRSN